MKIQKMHVALIVLSVISVSAYPQNYYLEGSVRSVHAGLDSWYGVRFYLDSTLDTTGDICNSDFAYTEPGEGSGHEGKVSVFLSAYLSGKKVRFSVVPGRNNYCKIVEGSISG